MTRSSFIWRRFDRIDAHPLANHEALRRRSELHSLAFLLLGGWKAARGFLHCDHTGLQQTPAVTAMKSSLGLIEATRVLRREALALG